MNAKTKVRIKKTMSSKQPFIKKKSHTQHNCFTNIPEKKYLLHLTIFGDVIAVPVLVEVHSRVSQYRLIPHENKQVPHCHFPSCTMNPCWHPVSE